MIEVKSRLKHGQFLDWLNTEFEMSRQTADNFVHVAQEFGDKMPNFSNFKPSVLYALASPSMPNEVRDDVIGKAEQGESVTLKQLNKLKAKYQDWGDQRND